MISVAPPDNRLGSELFGVPDYIHYIAIGDTKVCLLRWLVIVILIRDDTLIIKAHQPRYRLIRGWLVNAWEELIDYCPVRGEYKVGKASPMNAYDHLGLRKQGYLISDWEFW
jgi:hypothetical protein